MPSPTFFLPYGGLGQQMQNLLSRTTPLDSTVRFIRAIYEYELASFLPINMDNDAEVSVIIDTLTTFMDVDFDSVKGLNYGDNLIASGDTIVQLIDHESGEVEHVALSSDRQLHGSLVEFVISEIPSVCDLPYVTHPDTNPLSRGASILTNKFGLTFKLAQASLHTADGETETIPASKIVLLPLSYPQLHLQRSL